MPKVLWEEFTARHRRATAVFATHPMLPKALLDSFRRDGYAIQTPSVVLAEALASVVQGDWAVRTEVVPSERARRAYRKDNKAHAKRSIILLSEARDVKRVQAEIGRILPHAGAELMRGCTQLKDLEYGRKEYLRLALRASGKVVHNVRQNTITSDE